MKIPPLAHCTAAATGCLLLVGLWTWRVGLLAAEGELDEKLRAAQAKSAILSRQQKDAEDARSKFAILTTLDAQLAADRNAPKWATLLKVLVTTHGSETHLTQVTARPKMDAPEICELRIAGTSAASPSARVSADRFRRSLLAGLEELCTRGTVAVDFTSLEDLPNTTGTE